MKGGELDQQKQSGIGCYNLVDFAARYQKGFRNNVVPIRKVPDLVRKYEKFECYTTLFFYSEEILKYMERNMRNGRPSVAGYSDKVWGPFLVLDVDSEKLHEALTVSRELVSYFLEYWNLSQESLLVYFSGSAGFHILLDSRLFGKIEPSENLHLVFSEMRKKIATQAKVKKREAVDYAIKDKVRLFRVVNTINAKSGLYKVQLSLQELFRSSVKDISSRAKRARSVYFTDSTGLVSTQDDIKESEEAKETFQYALSRIKKRELKPAKNDYSIENREDPSKVLCEARGRIWNSHVSKGYRNNAAVRLIAQFRLSGFGKERAVKLIFLWNKKSEIGLLTEELLKSVESVYSSSIPYSYGCNDEILKKFCPFKDRGRCEDYRTFIDNVST